MNLRLLLILAFTSDLLIEATLIPRPFNSFRERLASRRRKKKPAQALSEGGWPKYFHEPGGSELANHYDSRYEHGILSYEDKQDTQVHMMRACLDFFKHNGMETWLAHGTLLGWWWNGKVWQRPGVELCVRADSYFHRCFRGTGTLTLRSLGLHSLISANTSMARSTTIARKTQILTRNP